MILSTRNINLMTIEKKLVKKQLEYTGSDEDMIAYLESLWSSSEEFKTNNKTFEKSKNENSNTKNLNNFQKSLNKMSDNLVFRGNFGAYNDLLEKELSLSKKNILLSNKDCNLLYNCFDDLFRYNSIRDSYFHKIKNADIFIKHKKNETDDPNNFRFLSNHHKLFKIIDKFWTNSLISVLQKSNKLPDTKIVRNNFSREFSMSIRDLAIEKLSVFKTGKHIIMIDLQKAFDNVSWVTLKKLLTSNLSRKINKVFAKNYVEQYMFMNTSRNIKYLSTNIKFKKSIATGLPSSTIVFSLIIEELIYQWINKENCENDLIINTYVDDMFLEFNSLDKCKYLIDSLFKFLSDNKFVVNKQKTLTNINILDYPKIKDTDCYLGLPFADTKKRYIEICIELFNNRYYKIDKNEIIELIENKKFPKVRREILGFFNYKLYGLKLFDYESIDVLNILKDSVE